MSPEESFEQVADVTRVEQAAEYVRAAGAARDDRALANVIKSARLPMWVYSHETLRFLTVNDAALREHGYKRQEFLSLTALDIRPREEVPRFLKESVRHPHSRVAPEAWIHLRKDDSRMNVNIQSVVTVFQKQKAEVVCVVCEPELDDSTRAEATSATAPENYYC